MFLLVIFWAALALGAAPVCSVCRQAIQGRYLQDQSGKIFCSERCIDTLLPVCSQCGKPCRQLLRQGEANFCSRECAVLAAPRCNNCGQPCAREVFRRNDRSYCSRRCYEAVELPHCVLCNKAFQAGQIRLSARGELTYCAECAQLPACFACMLPCRGKTLPDGRVICPECEREAVTDPQEIQRIFLETRRQLQDILGIPASHPIRLVCVEVPELERIAGGEPPPGGAGMRTALYVYEGDYIEGEGMTNERCSVYVLSHLPARRLAEMLAHELAHDYLRHAAPRQPNDKFAEGFAENISAELNRRTGNEALNFRMEHNPDAIYGDGYREVKDYLSKHGWKALLDQIRTGKTDL